MTPLSIVVANITPDTAGAARCVSSIVGQLKPDDQLVWVDTAGIECPWPVATSVAARSHSSRGRLYALGLSDARHPRIAFTDSFTVLGSTWRECAERGLDGVAVAGGPVAATQPRSLRSWAGFFVEYGPHAVAPFTSTVGDVAANNVVYDRAALDAVLAPGEPLWKSAVNTRLRANGQRLAVIEGMRVSSIKTYLGTDLTRRRVVAGRLYAGQRSGHWGYGRRTVAAVTCAVLPALAYARLAARIMKDPALLGVFVRSTPLILVALAGWSAGEAWGYVTGEGRVDSVF